VHLQRGHLTLCNGNYDVFMREYHLKHDQDEKKNEKITKKQQHYKSFIEEWGEHQSTAALAQDRVKKIARLEKERVTLIEEEPDIRIDFPETKALHDPVIIKIEGAGAGYGKKEILSDLKITVEQDARIGILGRNGQGKTTLVRLLTGEIESKKGRVIHTGALKIGYFSQDQADVLDMNLTPYDQLKQLLEGNDDQEKFYRSHLASFGLDQSKIKIKIRELSGGEKSRLAFALISAKKPHLIILDEPTNHLDIKARTALIESINKFQGAIIMVSHNAELMKATMKNYWIVNDGKVKELSVPIDSYLKQLIKKIETPNAGKSKKVPGGIKSKKNALFSPESKPTGKAIKKQGASSRRK